MFDLDIELVDGFFVAAVPGHIDVKRAWDRLRARLEESGRTAPNRQITKPAECGGCTKNYAGWECLTCGVWIFKNRQAS